LKEEQFIPGSNIVLKKGYKIVLPIVNMYFTANMLRTKNKIR